MWAWIDVSMYVCTYVFSYSMRTCALRCGPLKLGVFCVLFSGVYNKEGYYLVVYPNSVQEYVVQCVGINI